MKADESKSKERKSVAYGTLISEIASEISKKYVENENYWTSVKLEHPEDIQFFSNLCQLA